MDKEIARSLLPLTNNRDLFPSLLDYIESRIKYHKDVLATAQTVDDIRKSQGAIRELSRILTLKDEALGVLKGE